MKMKYSDSKYLYTSSELLMENADYGNIKTSNF